MSTAEKLRELVSSATPGPWIAELSEAGAHDDGSDEWIVWQSADRLSDSTMLIEGDARFIASMRDVVEEIAELLEYAATDMRADTTHLLTRSWLRRYDKLADMLP